MRRSVLSRDENLRYRGDGYKVWHGDMSLEKLGPKPNTSAKYQVIRSPDIDMCKFISLLALALRYYSLSSIITTTVC
jgi:hypothetical protein